MFEFAYPWVLTGLLLLPVFYMFERFWRKRPSVVVSQTLPFKRVSRKRFRPTFPEFCRLLAAAVLIVALARPRKGDEKVIIRAQGIDMILALDMSGSMRAVDVPAGMTDPRKLLEAIRNKEIINRIEVAKKEIRRFIEKRPNDRIGLLGFADLAYSFAPPTLDHAWLLAQLERLQPGMIGDATGIASPIGSAVSRLKNAAAPRRVLVLFTDGTNTAVNRLTPEQAAKLAKDFNIIIHTVGIGSGNAYVLDTTFGSRFIPAGDNFDEKLLRTIADTTGGSYFHADDGKALRQVMDGIDKLEKTTVEQPKYVEYKEYAPRLALITAVILLLAFTADCTWKLRLP
ncbi:MAG: VWA domain-containing protein [Lentisphaeria bacterium]|nr:VWA domain-containing protein [Lentisphaeria bacterium]